MLMDIVQVVGQYRNTACQIMNAHIKLATYCFGILQIEITCVRMQLGRDNVSDNCSDIRGVQIPSKFTSLSTVPLSRPFPSMITS